MPGTGFALGMINQLFLLTSQLKCCWATLLLEVVASLSGQMEPQDMLHSE